jgi:peptidoglycan/LPS O-acetylase OafA/YrhL
MRRYAQLDGLRGVAALIVVLAHYVLAFQPAMYFGSVLGNRASFAAALPLARSPLTLFWQPELAVAVFFVLSGFVLAAGLRARPAPLAELVLRRWLRLTIPIVVTSAIIWAVLAAGLHADRRLAALNHSAWLDMSFGWLAWEPNDLRTVLFQATIDLYARGRHWWNTSLWTMPIEFWGSVGLFAATLLLHRLRASARLRLGVAAAAFAALWATDYAGFAAGAALFELSCRPRGARWAWPAGAALAAAGLLLGGTAYYGLWIEPWNTLARIVAPFSPNPVLALHRVAAVLLVAAALVWRPAIGLLHTRPCQFLGRVSFMMYLCHAIMLCSVASWLILKLSPACGYNLATALALPAFLAVLLPVAWVGTLLVDRPGTRFAHRAARAALARLRPKVAVTAR